MLTLAWEQDGVFKQLSLVSGLTPQISPGIVFHHCGPTVFICGATPSKKHKHKRGAYLVWDKLLLLIISRMNIIYRSLIRSNICRR